MSHVTVTVNRSPHRSYAVGALLSIAAFTLSFTLTYQLGRTPEPVRSLWPTCYVTDCSQYVGPPGPKDTP